MYKSILVLLGAIALTSAQLTFTNPILDRNSADPAILRLGDFYYLTLSENTERDLTIFKSPILTSFREAESKIAYSAPAGYSNLWASEMHLIDGELYIYFTMDGNGKDHRMYVIKADNPNDPFGNWSDAIRYRFAHIIPTKKGKNNWFLRWILNRFFFNN
jgi:GH43 family beta-xylosidase